MNSYQELNETMGKSEFQDNLSILRGIPFFSEFPLEVLKVFAYLCTREMYKPKDIIFSQNDDDGCSYCILSGEAVLSRIHDNKEVTIRTCSDNSFFGAFTLSCRTKRLFTLTASSDTCCLMLTRESFQETIDQFPGSREIVARGLVKSVVAWEENFIKKNIDCTSCLKTLGVSLL